VIRRGRQKFYRANVQHPLFPELKRIVYKTAALGDVLRDALVEIPGIRAAFIYGSVAKGAEGAASDVDLMVLGETDPSLLDRALRGAEETLGREVTLRVMRTDEWAARIRKRDAFLMELLSSPKIFLIGDDRALPPA
jgi:predicted nucleotidyltransferase